MKDLIIIILSILLFSCQEKDYVVDIDGNKYKTKKIGETVWFTENLKTTRFSNGDSIPYIYEDSIWAEARTGGYCYYNHHTINREIYGNLYNWYAVNDPRELCPCGWEVASKDQFAELSTLFGGDAKSGMYLKDISTKLWITDTTSTNESGFASLPNGHRDENFGRLGHYAFYWHQEDYFGPSCMQDGLCAYECSLLSEFSYMNRDFGNKYRGMAVRCVQVK